MSLAERQQHFLDALLDEKAPVDPGREAGMAVYRNAYRARLVDALAQAYERTCRLAGEDAFRQAAAHHLIAHPPASWTLDHAGAGFAATCAELFANDPDVAEIAALEWAMAEAFTAADHAPLDAAGFAAATAGFSDEDWEGFGLAFLPGTALVPAAHDLVAMWQGLAGDGPAPEPVTLPEAAAALVWREREKPVFAMIAAPEAEVLAAMLQGASYGAACAVLADRMPEDAALAEAGAMLGRWLQAGIVAGVTRA